MLRGIDALKTFDILYATKGKGGGSFHEVETLNVYAFGLSFDYNDYGIASTVLILFFLMIVAHHVVDHLPAEGERSHERHHDAARRPPRRRHRARTASGAARPRPTADAAPAAAPTPSSAPSMLILIVLPVHRAAGVDAHVLVQDQRRHLRRRARPSVFTPTPDNYDNVLGRNNYFGFIFNSFWVALWATVLSLILGVPAAYSMSRFAMHRSALVVLMARIIPGVSLLVPWYFIFANLRLVGGYGGADPVPHVRRPAADRLHHDVVLRLDADRTGGGGAGGRADPDRRVPADHPAAVGARDRDRRHPRPSSSPGTTSCSRWCSPARTPRRCRWPSSTSSSYASIDWGGLMAAAVVVTVPIMVIALFTQKYIVSGLTAGATKG